MSEQLKTKLEYGDKAALESEGSERSKELAAQRERSAAEKERSSKEKEDTARHEVEHVVAEQEKKEQEKTVVSPAERRLKISKNARASRGEVAFKKEMKRVQAELSAPERTFSKVIHNKTVEKVSEAAGATVARPNAILYGSLFAFILTSLLYGWARYANYPLSGFETIGAFILGWLVGLIIDYIRILLSGGRTA